jgi:peptidyl-prolyl cis-trans isomerase C
MNVRDPRTLLATAVAVSVLAAHGSLCAQQTPPVPAAAPTQDEAENPIVAKVGDQTLRTSDLMAELNRQIPLTFYHSKVPEKQMLAFRRKAFDQLVERSLVHQDAIARKIEVTEAEVVAEFKRALRSSEEYSRAPDKELDQEVAKLLPQFRALVMRRLLIDKNEARFRDSVPKPDDAAVKAVYEQMQKDNAESLLAPPKAHLLHIYIGVDPAGGGKHEEEKQQKADNAAKQLADGKPFSVVAEAFSEDDSAKQGGDLGTVQRGFFKSSEIEKVAFALKAGETSPVFRSLYGFHIVRCVEAEPRRNLTIEETRPMLEQWFHTEHTQRRRAVWLKELKDRYKIEVLAEEFVGPPPEVPTKVEAPAMKGH